MDLINKVVRFRWPTGTTWLVGSKSGGIYYGRGLGIVFPLALSDRGGNIEVVLESTLSDDDVLKVRLLRENPKATFDEIRGLFVEVTDRN